MTHPRVCRMTKAYKVPLIDNGAVGGQYILDVRATFRIFFENFPHHHGPSTMHEYYKMGRTYAVATEIAESVSFLRECHTNLLQELDDLKTF